MHLPIDEQFVNEYLGLVEVGASHLGAVHQVALSNEVEPEGRGGSSGRPTRCHGSFLDRKAHWHGTASVRETPNPGA